MKKKLIWRVPIIREFASWKSNRVTVVAYPRLRQPGEPPIPGFVTLTAEPVGDPMLTPARADQLGRALIAAAKVASARIRR
jgi:hypothetical protein